MKLVLLTTFGWFSPSYSLCSVVFDQARAALLNGDDVSIWTVEGCLPDEIPKDIRHRIKHRPILPKWIWKPDDINEELLPKIIGVLEVGLSEEGPCMVISHDLIFQSSFLTYAKALHRMFTPDNCIIYHTCHSATKRQEEMPPHTTWRISLPKGHRLLSLNLANAHELAKYYETSMENIDYLINARDITYALGMSDRLRSMVYDWGLLDAEIVQVYPLSFTRANDKGIHHLLQIFHQLNHLGVDSKLVFVNADAGGADAIKARDYADVMASNLGLSDKVFFTSDRMRGGQQLAEGLYNDEVNALFQISNLFVFPTISEIAPLVQMEAALAGCLLVLNTQVGGCLDITHPMEALFYSFGNVADRTARVDYQDVAKDIIHELDASKANQSKRAILRSRSIPELAKTLKKLEPVCS